MGAHILESNIKKSNKYMYELLFILTPGFLLLMSHVPCMYITAFLLGDTIKNKLNAQYNSVRYKKYGYFVDMKINEEKSLIHRKMCITYC